MIHGPAESKPAVPPHELVADFPELVWREQPRREPVWPMHPDDEGRPPPEWWPPKAWRSEPR